MTYTNIDISLLGGNEIVVQCYGKERVMDRAEARNEFFVVVAACEGIERERYMNILLDIEAGYKVCSDGYSEIQPIRKENDGIQR